MVVRRVNGVIRCGNRRVTVLRTEGLMINCFGNVGNTTTLEGRTKGVGALSSLCRLERGTLSLR